MYNPEYIAYMNEQIKKALNKERQEFLDDLDDFEDSKWLRRHKKKWREKLKE